MSAGATVVYVCGGAATGKTTMCRQMPKHGVLVAEAEMTPDAVLEKASKDPSVRLVIIVSNKVPPADFAASAKAKGMQPFVAIAVKDAEDALRVPPQQRAFPGFVACNVVHRANAEFSAWTNAAGPPVVPWAASAGLVFQ